MTRPQARAIPSTGFFVGRLSAYRPLLFVACTMLLVLWHSSPLLLGVLARAFFDALEGRAPAGLTVSSVAALAVAAGLAKVAIIYSSICIWVPLIFAGQGLLRRNLLARILGRPGARAVPGSIGEALSTLRDDVDAMAETAGWLPNAIAGVLFAAGGAAILLSVDARVTLLVFLPLVAVIALAQAARSRLERARERSREATAQVTGAIGEIFSSVQAIQVAGAEDRIGAHLRRLGDRRRQAMLHDRLQALALDAVFANTARVGAGLTLLVAASAMRSGEFSVGDFALFATYLMQVADYTGFLGYLVATYRQAGVAFRRGVALLQGAPPRALIAHHPLHLTGPLPALPPLRSTHDDRLETLQVAGLTLRHAGSGRGIADVSFTLRRGTLTVVAGRIGSGKTTLLRALLGLLEAQAGEVRWNGHPVADPARFFVPPRVGYTPQVPTLLSGSLRENILLGLPADEPVLAQAVQGAALERDVAAFPQGLDTLVGPRGVRLSGGQVQRTASARMLAREPQLLVIDDLSSALDVETERLLWERLFALGVTSLAVSHRPAVLQRADQVLLLDEGRLVARGTLAELLRACPEMRRLYAGGLAHRVG